MIDLYLVQQSRAARSLTVLILLGLFWACQCGMRQVAEESQHANKIEQVAKAIRAALLAAPGGQGRFLRPILASFAVVGELEGALGIVKQVKERQLTAEGEPFLPSVTQKLMVSGCWCLTAYFSSASGSNVLFYPEPNKVAFAYFFSAMLTQCLWLLATVTCAFKPGCPMNDIWLLSPHCESE